MAHNCKSRQSTSTQAELTRRSYIKGVAYQQNYDGNGTSGTDSSNDYTDPLADISTVKRDIPYLQQLSTNTIRVYAIDPTVDHSAAMSALDTCAATGWTFDQSTCSAADPLWP